MSIFIKNKFDVPVKKRNKLNLGLFYLFDRIIIIQLNSF